MIDDLDLSGFAEAKLDRICGDDLVGGPRTVTITKVSGAIEDGKKQAIVNFGGDDGKPFKPCKTMLRLMMAIWGNRASNMVGKSMTLYRDPSVTFGAQATGGVRISHMSHMERDAEVILTLKKGKKGVVKVKPLQQRAASPAVATPPATAAVTPSTSAEQPSGAAPTEDAAKGWADACIDSISNAADRAELANLDERAKKKLANRPDLLARVKVAVDFRNGLFDADVTPAGLLPVDDAPEYGE